jgi:hypothetical protein
MLLIFTHILALPMPTIMKRTYIYNSDSYNSHLLGMVNLIGILIAITQTKCNSSNRYIYERWKQL